MKSLAELQRRLVLGVSSIWVVSGTPIYTPTGTLDCNKCPEIMDNKKPAKSLFSRVFDDLKHRIGGPAGVELRVMLLIYMVNGAVQHKYCNAQNMGAARCINLLTERVLLWLFQ